MNTIETHSRWGVGAALCPGRKIVSYSIHVIVEYNLSGSKIICRQIFTRCVGWWRKRKSKESIQLRQKVKKVLKKVQ